MKYRTACLMLIVTLFNNNAAGEEPLYYGLTASKWWGDLKGVRFVVHNYNGTIYLDRECAYGSASDPSKRLWIAANYDNNDGTDKWGGSGGGSVDQTVMKDYWCEGWTNVQTATKDTDNRPGKHTGVAVVTITIPFAEHWATHPPPAGRTFDLGSYSAGTYFGPPSD